MNDFKLSDQQQAVNEGQNPLPLYLAVNVKENNISAFDFKGNSYNCEKCHCSGEQSYFPKLELHDV